MAQQHAQVYVIGGGAIALLTALQLHAKGTPVTLIDPTFRLPPPPFNPECNLVGEQDVMPALFQHSLNLWRNLSETLQLPPVLTTAEVLDLANTEGRQHKLRQEALLDALGGEEVIYRTGVVRGLNPDSPMLGIKVWANGLAFTTNLITLLREAITQRNIPVLYAPVKQLSLSPLMLHLTNGAVVMPEKIILACSKTAREVLPRTGLTLPIRPTRTHVLAYTLPEAELPRVVLHRLTRGHLFAHTLEPSILTAFYDGLLDPLQSTTAPVADENVLSALHSHLVHIFGSTLAAAQPLPPRTLLHYLCPDFLPALGPWSTQPNLLLAVGFVGRETPFAAAVAHLLVQQAAEANAEFPTALAPNRFANGLWQPVPAPASLTWVEPKTEAEAKDLRTHMEYMENIHTLETKKAQYAEQVHLVERHIQSAATTFKERNAKGKIQMSSVNNN